VGIRGNEDSEVGTGYWRGRTEDSEDFTTSLTLMLGYLLYPIQNAKSEIQNLQ